MEENRNRPVEENAVQKLAEEASRLKEVEKTARVTGGVKPIHADKSLLVTEINHLIKETVDVGADVILPFYIPLTMVKIRYVYLNIYFRDAVASDVLLYIDNGFGFGSLQDSYRTDKENLDFTRHFSGSGRKQFKFTCGAARIIDVILRGGIEDDQS